MRNHSLVSHSQCDPAIATCQTRVSEPGQLRGPVVWINTPYNRRKYRGREHAAEDYPGFGLNLAPHGYVVAVVDFRGLYGSFGSNTAYNRGEWVDASRCDAYDATEWFEKPPWSAGKTGMRGCSATGGSQTQAVTVRPPSLRVPAVEADSLSPVARRDKEAVPVEISDGAALLSAALAEHANTIESVGDIRFRDSVSPTTGLTWWLKSSPYSYLSEMMKADIGVMSVANWHELATRYGAFFTFNTLDPSHAKLLVGPGTRCGIDDMAPASSNRSYQMTGALRASHRRLAKAPFNYLGLPWMNHTQADRLPVPRDEPIELKIKMLPMSYIFEAGNKLRLTLSLSDPSGREDAGSTAAIIVSSDKDSFITLPVIPN